MSAKRSAGAGASNMAAKRIKKEIADLSKENLGAITLVPNESNIFAWKATIPGPQGSPYEGGVFEVGIRIPDDYPFSPPHLHFVTKVYHCNVASSGAICLDLLKTAWSPALSLYKVILSLSSLLTDPNPSDPLVPAIAQEYKRNRAKHDATAKEWVQLYALPKDPPPQAATSSKAKVAAPRPRPLHRPDSSSSVPPAQVAGTRRPNPYSGTNGTNGAGSANRPVEITSSSDSEVEGAAGSNGRTRERPSKRARPGGGGSGAGESSRGRGTNADDVIVIDD